MSEEELDYDLFIVTAFARFLFKFEWHARVRLIQWLVVAPLPPSYAVIRLIRWLARPLPTWRRMIDVSIASRPPEVRALCD